MEDGYKLDNPPSMTVNANCILMGPIGIIAWVQREHAKFVRDHECPAVTTKPPENINSTLVIPAGRNYRTNMTCYHCGEDRHIKPKCPKLKVPQKTIVPRQKTENEKTEGEPKARKLLAAWKNIRQFDLTHVHEDEDGKRLIFCTKCCDHATGQAGIFNLIHVDSKHQENYKPTAPEGNLMMAHAYIDTVHTGPHLNTVLEHTDETDHLYWSLVLPIVKHTSRCHIDDTHPEDKSNR
jgi:hypothetical protein